jgi:hypothetical protein
MDELTRIWQEIIARPEGPLALRFYMQPLMATLFAIRDGVHDARQHRPPYFWALFAHTSQRRELMRSGWKSVRKIFILAVILDTAYELLVLGAIRPIQTLLVAITLAIVPYVLIRGPVNRIAKAFDRKSPRKRAA